MAHISWSEVRDRAIRFSREHAGDRSERAEKQTFWNDFFQVFGLRRASIASFEENVKNLKGNTSSIDLLWRGKLLVEHKSFGEDLALAKSQAFEYIEDLTREQRWDEIPRYVLVSDFARFVLYDLEPEEQRGLPLFAGRKFEPHHFTLSEFPRHIRVFAFMLGQTRVRLDPEDPANEKAYARMCELHDALKDGGFTGHELERLLVRILFCLFAEDTHIFEPDTFTQFVRTQTREDGADLGAKLNELFDWLNNPVADKPLPDNDPFYGFRFVNGGLFDERLGFPRFTRAMRDSLLFCCDFQWAKISPAVFGSLFQGVMEDRDRRQQGAHYTNERNITKVIRSLFLDDLHDEWMRVKSDRSTRRRAAMEAFHQKLRSLQFLDPACGCGNFLVLAYRELRLLEVDVVRELAIGAGGQQLLPTVNVDQFHGIELFEWPVRIAEVAMWLMDHQMNLQASEVFGEAMERLPLTTSPHIISGNALRLDWNEILLHQQCSYVLGNPPYSGAKYQSDEQRADMRVVAGELENFGLLDYVCGWYLKAAAYIQGTHIVVGFVSTNSITQGEQVAPLWRPLLDRFHVNLHFAHRTFTWESEARGKAHVHVVIIGFAAFPGGSKKIYDYEDEEHPTVSITLNINPYLVDGSNITIANRSTPLCDVPEIGIGNKPIDGGYYLFTPEQKNEFLINEPGAKKFFRRWIGSEEFINGIERWFLWLGDAEPHELRGLPKVMNRVNLVAKYRRGEVPAKTKPDIERNKKRNELTQKLAATPTRLHVENMPSSEFLVIPEVSSEARPYIPIGFLKPDAAICSNLVKLMPNATLYHFGVLTSVVQMAWVRTVAGRLKSDYRYSVKLVFNNFPWPNPTDLQRARVEDAARAVLAAREPHLPPRGMSTLADLYDPLAMPPDLARAHMELDRAVERCYRAEAFRSDRERVEFLFRLYEQLTAPLLPATPRRRGRRTQVPVSQRPRHGRTPGLPSAQHH